MADCDSQASLMEPENSTDPAMVRTVEISSAAETTGSHSMKKQRKETPSRRRGDTPVRSSKGHVTAQGGSSVLVGDNSRDKSGTQKSKVTSEFPSPSDSELCSPDASEGIRSGFLHDSQMPHRAPAGQVGSRNKVSHAECKEQVGAERGS